MASFALLLPLFKSALFRLTRSQDIANLEASAVRGKITLQADLLAGAQHPNKVVANIPYNITGPIVEKLLGKIRQPAVHNYDSIVLLVQKEVALRMCAKAGNSNFGALSVRVQYLADCQMICDVPAKAFEPPPKVDSAVIRLLPRPIGIPPQSPAYLEKLLRQSFASRRKMLRNNLKSVIEPERLNGLLEELDLNPQARAEDLNVADWVRFADRLEAEPAIAPVEEGLAPDLDEVLELPA